MPKTIKIDPHEYVLQGFPLYLVSTKTPKKNHFHGFGNYFEVIFTHSYSPGPPRDIREIGKSVNCPAKRLCCKA